MTPESSNCVLNTSVSPRVGIMGDCSEKTGKHRTVETVFLSPLACSLALHGIKHTSKTFPDVKIEIIITTRMVTDESLTLLPQASHAVAYFKN